MEKDEHWCKKYENLEGLLDFYKEAASDYDKVVKVHRGYVGPETSVEAFVGTLKQYKFSEDSKILDVGAGTGLVGEELHKRKFTNIDALDASQALLDEAGKKGIYNHLFVDVLGPKHRLKLADNSYDAAICVGVFTLNHVKAEGAMDEMARVVRPGGFICFTIREDVMFEPEYGYKDKIQQLCHDQVWKLVSHSSDDEDTDAAQLMSLPVLLQRSVMAPLLAQVSLVNSAIVAYFMDDVYINQHFNLFKKLLFMEDGEFSLSLSNQLFEKLASGVTPREMCSATVMNGIVGKALQLSVYSDTTEHAQNLAFALKSLPDIFKPNEMGTLDFLELRYRVPWPVKIVITEKSVVKYNKIFSFMLRLKRLSWVLRDIWFHLRHIACSLNAAMSPQIRQLQLYRHEMQHFVHNLEGYLSNQILNVTWSEFQEGLLNVRSLDDLHNQHAAYLRKAIFRSLLSRKAAPVMSLISDLGTLILKLRAQLLASPWQQDPHTGHVTHPKFDVMCNTHKGFKEYSGFLFTVVSKLVNSGYQSHLADFLLRINFNNFYNVEQVT